MLVKCTIIFFLNITSGNEVITHSLTWAELVEFPFLMAGTFTDICPPHVYLTNGTVATLCTNIRISGQVPHGDTTGHVSSHSAPVCLALWTWFSYREMNQV